MAAYYRWQNQQLLLFCHLQPKASNTAFAGLHGDRIKIRVKAAPVDGKANKQLIAFVATEFGVTKSAVQIRSGENSRQKTLSVNQPEKIPEHLNIQ